MAPPSANVPQPGPLDYLKLLPTTGYALSCMAYTAITRPLSSHAKPVDLFRDTIYTAMRAFLANINTVQEQWSQSTTEAEYLTWAKKQRDFQPDTEELESGLRVHWIGPRGAKYVLLFFHGGGFNVTANAGHFIWLRDLQQDASKHVSISVAIPSYTLAPRAHYPTQLRQAAESLNWLMTKHGKSPANIFIGGDSAGGNLTLALLSHLLHPHPDVPKLDIPEPLAGAVLISPWCEFVPNDDSVKRNSKADLVTPAAARRWSRNYLGPQELDEYNQPAGATKEWFSGLEAKVKGVIIYGAGGEILIDSITAFAHKLEAVYGQMELVVTPAVAHDDIIIDRMFGYHEKAAGTKAIESWLAKRMQT